jgi:Putative auto-transporter adhesin, head GIN domain
VMASAPLSRRLWLADAMATLAGLAASSPGSGAQTTLESRAVSGFHSVLWDAAGELAIEQSNREHLSIEAEPAVLAKIVTEVRQGRLSISFAPGRIETRQPIRFRLEVKTLAALESRGSGTLRIGPLSTASLSLRLGGSDALRLARLLAQSLDARLDGSGDVTIEGGQVARQRVVIAGAANYNATRLASREADVAIDGSGELRLAVSERLGATIAGSGDVLFVGQPRVTQTVTGAGDVRRLRGQEVPAQKP